MTTATFRSLFSGDDVIFNGLRSRPELNGKQATLISFSAGRWGVRVAESSECLRVKPTNLLPCAERGYVPTITDLSPPAHLFPKPTERVDALHSAEIGRTGYCGKSKTREDACDSMMKKTGLLPGCLEGWYNLKQQPHPSQMMRLGEGVRLSATPAHMDLQEQEALDRDFAYQRRPRVPAATTTAASDSEADFEAEVEAAPHCAAPEPAAAAPEAVTSAVLTEEQMDVEQEACTDGKTGAAMTSVESPAVPPLPADASDMDVDTEEGATGSDFAAPPLPAEPDASAALPTATTEPPDNAMEVEQPETRDAGGEAATAAPAAAAAATAGAAAATATAAAASAAGGEDDDTRGISLPAGSKSSKYACGGELGLCPGCDKCIEGEKAGDSQRPRAIPMPHDPTKMPPAALDQEAHLGPLQLAEVVQIILLQVHTSYNGLRGRAVHWHAPSGFENHGRYEVALEGHENVLVHPCELVRAHTIDYSGHSSLKHRLFSPDLPAELEGDWKDVHMPTMLREKMPPQLAMLASLVPVTEEQPNPLGLKAGIERKLADPQEWAAHLRCDEEPYADISDVDTSDDNKVVWNCVMPEPIKRVMSRLLRLGKLAWEDLLEDGNLLWEITLTDRPEWIEPDRWMQTVINFVLLMAWERSVDRYRPLYPTARLQILRELYYGEWAMRTHRLGLQIWPLCFEDGDDENDEDDEMSRPPQRGRMAEMASELSDYEKQRNRNVLDNQRRLRELFGTDQVAESLMPRQAPRAAPHAAPRAAPPAGPSRSASRFEHKAKVSYAPKPTARGSDSEGGSDDDGSGDEYGGGSGSDEDEEEDEGAFTEDEDEGGARKAVAKPKGKGKAAAKPKPKAKAGAGDGQAKKRKKVNSRGATASVPKGGRGFKCPVSKCEVFFDTAEEALEHAKTLGHKGVRDVDEKGKTCCLWDGCKHSGQCCGPNGFNFYNIQRHEALHDKGSRPRDAFICPGCSEAHQESAGAWACAAKHGIEQTNNCLWDGCGCEFKRPVEYRRHEAVHTGIWPFNCPVCAKGFGQSSRARACCTVVAACKCGQEFKGVQAKRNFNTHQKKCRAGAASLLALN